jgi:hypothetical protein
MSSLVDDPRRELERLQEADVAHAVAPAQQYVDADDKKPGSQQVFGVPFDVHGLIDHIGLDDDTNRNLTRRLLLLESRELAGDIHSDCWGEILGRYLRFGIKNNGSSISVQ